MAKYVSELRLIIKSFIFFFQGLYYQIQLSDDLESNCICVKSSYEEPNTDPISSKEIFFFDDGSTVFWNVPHLERENVLHFLRNDEG